MPNEKDEDVQKKHAEDEDIDDDDLDIDEDDEEDEDEDDEGDDDGDGEDDDEDDDEDPDKGEGGEGQDPDPKKKPAEDEKRVLSLKRQRAIWKKRALAKGWKKDEKPEPKDPKKEPKQVSDDETRESRLFQERIEFRQDHPDLPKKMVKEIQKYAQVYGISMEKALRKPLIQKYVNDSQLRERLADASVSPKHKSSLGKQNKDWSSASNEDYQAHLAKIRQRG